MDGSDDFRCEMRKNVGVGDGDGEGDGKPEHLNESRNAVAEGVRVRVRRDVLAPYPIQCVVETGARLLRIGA